jgi:hypothetical protein
MGWTAGLTRSTYAGPLRLIRLKMGRKRDGSAHKYFPKPFFFVLFFLKMSIEPNPILFSSLLILVKNKLKCKS